MCSPAPSIRPYRVDGQMVAIIAEEGGTGESPPLLRVPPPHRSSMPGAEIVSVSHATASPYLPLIEFLKEYSGIEPDDDATQQDKIRRSPSPPWDAI